MLVLFHHGYSRVSMLEYNTTNLEDTQTHLTNASI